MDDEEETVEGRGVNERSWSGTRWERKENGRRREEEKRVSGKYVGIVNFYLEWNIFRVEYTHFLTLDDGSFLSFF